MDVGVIQRKLSRLQDLYVDGVIDRAAYDEKYRALIQQQDAAEAARAAQSAERDLGPLRQLLAGDFRSIYATLSPQERHTLWASVIDRIVVKDGRYGHFDLDVIFLP